MHDVLPSTDTAVGDDYPLGVIPPRQGRSTETFERILDAAEELLDGRDFEEIPVLEIAAAADVSSSSFYARFKSKAVLLKCLHERHIERMHQMVDAVVASGAWDSMPTRAIAHAIVSLYLDHRRQHERLLLTLRLAERREPGFADRRTACDRRIVETITAYFVRREGIADVERFTLRMNLATRVIAAALQDAVNPPDTFAARIGIDDERLAAELTDLFMAYVGLDGVFDGPRAGR